MLSAAALSLAVTTAAHGQTCKNKVSLDTVYQKSTGANRYEYYVQVRNMTSTPVTLSLRLGNFKDVSLFSPMLPNVKLLGNASQQIRIGTGTNAQINSGSVDLLVDRPTGTKPYVSANDCK